MLGFFLVYQTCTGSRLDNKIGSIKVIFELIARVASKGDLDGLAYFMYYFYGISMHFM